MSASLQILTCTVIGAVRRTVPNKNSFVQFTELHLKIVLGCSSANCTYKFLLGAVRRTAPQHNL